MSITFTCLCGKRLKAQESSAGKRTQCPQCGEPVGIPLSSAPTGPPVSRKEAARAASDPEAAKSATQNSATPAKPVPQPSAPNGNSAATPKPYFMVDDDTPAPPPRIPKSTRKAKSKPQPQTRGLPAGVQPGAAAEAASKSLEESPADGIELRRRPRWYRLISRGRYRGPSGMHEFGWSYGNSPLAATLAGLLTLTIGAGALVLPHAMQSYDATIGLLILTVVALILTAGHVCSYLNQTIVNAARRLGSAINLDPVRTSRTSLAWILAVLAGPILPAAGTYLYWLRIGLADPVDWVILAELIWLTFFWFTASLLSYGIDADLKSLLPQRVFRKARVIPKAIAIRSAAGAVLCAATIAGVTFALMQIHTEPFVGFVALGGTIVTALPLTVYLAASLGKAGVSVLPKAEEKVDAKAEEFERELQASQG